MARLVELMPHNNNIPLPIWITPDQKYSWGEHSSNISESESPFIDDGYPIGNETRVETLNVGDDNGNVCKITQEFGASGPNTVMSISAQTSDGRDYEVSIIKHSRVQGITIALAGKTGDAQSPIPVWQQTELDTGRNTGQGFIDYGLARYSEDGQLTMVEFGADVPIIDKISDVNCDDEPGASDAEEYERWLAAKLDQIQKSAGVILASVNIEQVRPGVHRLNFYSSNHAFSIKPVVDDIPDNFLIIDGGPVVFVAVEAVGIQETYEVKISDGILHILVTRNDATQKYIKLPLNIKKPAIRSLNELNLQERMQLSDMTCLGYNWEEIFQFEFNPKF